jgi:small-conductance mechanosensitive channel
VKVRQGITVVVLLLLVAAAIVGMVWTRALPAANEGSESQSGKKAMLQSPRALVDLRPLQTARRLGAMAGMPEEQILAHQAEKVGDHEVDLSFLDALRTAEENPPPLSPEAKQIAARKTKDEQTLKEDQDNVALLTRKLAAATESQKEIVQDQLDVAQAQTDLDQNELDDAAEALEQAGGDPQSKIKRLQAEHEESGHGASSVGTAVNPHEQDYQAHTLLSVFRAWQALREKKAQLQSARDETTAKQQRLNARHQTLMAQVEEEKENREAVRQQAKGFATAGLSKSGQAAAAPTKPSTTTDGQTANNQLQATAKTALDALKQYTRDQKNLADLGRRVQDEQDLSDIYANWIALVETRERAALHNVIAALLWILLVLLAVYAADRLIEHLFTGMSEENKRIDTLRAVVKFAAQAVGAIAILFIVFGMPTQTTTVLGLAGAGLTVAMKDFIVAFFGWFVLMGRNGIRVGDWVEINGVGGEVVEVGLLKTVLLETGSWTDAGHPTGRRVSFVNSFAIEGHFFNFTTSGQWMWDELQVLIPPGQDPYPIIDGLQKLVEKETAANASKAEAEWQAATSRYRVKTLSATPGINVVPTGSGIEVHVRYITRVYERYEARKRMYEAVVEMMHGRREAVRA